MKSDEIFISPDGLYEIIPLTPLRRTPGVSFDIVPPELAGRISAVDRVMHEKKAISPGPIGEISRPWYMHPYQEDHLMVLHGKRTVDLYSLKAGRIETLVATADGVWRDEAMIFKGPHLLKWTTGIFHRIMSDALTGSISINLAIHHEGFNIKTNFNIYELNTDTGEYSVLREGYLDQNG